MLSHLTINNPTNKAYDNSRIEGTRDNITEDRINNQAGTLTFNVLY